MASLRNLARKFGRFVAGYGYARGVSASVEQAITAGPTEPIDPSTAFESADIYAGPVMFTGIALLITLGLITFLLYFVFAYFTHHEALISPPPLPANAHGSRMPPEPRVQDDPRSDMSQMRAHEDQRLHSYQWVDRNKNIVSIPIDRAMQLVAGEGIPAQPGTGFIYYDPQAGSRRTGFEGKVEPEPR